jgi:hypothetical protein
MASATFHLLSYLLSANASVGVRRKAKIEIRVIAWCG